MNGQLQLNAEQVIVAIQRLNSVEKRKVQRYLPYLFDIPENMAFLKMESEQTIIKDEPHQYAFSEVRHLLRDVQGSMSKGVISDRKDRI